MSLINCHTTPGQHTKPTPTLLGYGKGVAPFRADGYLPDPKCALKKKKKKRKRKERKKKKKKK